MTAALPPPGWPLADWSRIVTHRPHRWHVQEAGAGPTLMFIHGAAGATHSWRDILPDLARDHHVVALDLPGQGFTRMGTRARCGLAPSSEDIASLAEAQGWRVDTVIGHSAGAAIALQLAGDLDPAPRRVIGINAALEHFSGAAGWLFPAMAKMMAANPLTATMLSLSATRGMVERLLGVTGGEIDARGIDCYLHLFRQCASAQFAPCPASDHQRHGRVHRRVAGPSITSRPAAISFVDGEPSSTSNSNSSCTCSSIRRHPSIAASIRIIARRMMSAAVPWIGALIAARAAKPARRPLGVDLGRVDLAPEQRLHVAVDLRERLRVVHVVLDAGEALEIPVDEALRLGPRDAQVARRPKPEIP
jgi:putative magnesium chelatase accessory protein